MAKTWSGRLISKGQLKGKGKFGVGSKKDLELSDNRTADIVVGNKGQQAGEFVLKGMLLNRFGIMV